MCVLALTFVGACSSGGEGTATGTTARAPDFTGGSPFTLPPSGPVDDDDQGIGPPTPSELAGFDTLPLPRVCMMVSVDEVRAATGADATSASEASRGDTITCFVVDGQGENLVAVAAGPASSFDDAATAPDAAPVEGLGDAAVWSGGKLHIRIGTEEVAVKVFAATGVVDADMQAVASTIAADVLTRYQPPATATG